MKWNEFFFLKKTCNWIIQYNATVGNLLLNPRHGALQPISAPQVRNPRGFLLSRMWRHQTTVHAFNVPRSRVWPRDMPTIECNKCDESRGRETKRSSLRGSASAARHRAAGTTNWRSKTSFTAVLLQLGASIASGRIRCDRLHLTVNFWCLPYSKGRQRDESWEKMM